MSTSYDADKQIDFQKLERELDNAVEADARYWRENDAKFRAVNQKVATYDEFKDIVQASHLKPLEKDDRLTDMKFTQPWNTQAAKKELDPNKPTNMELPKGQTLPTTAQAFVREWRKFNKNTAEQYAYLILNMGGERLESIFKQEIGFGLLGEFARCLNCEYKNDDFSNIVNILDHLSKTNRFSLTLQFLSSKEKQDILELFGKLKVDCDTQSNSDDEHDERTLVDKFEALEKVYIAKKL